jgi:hypothetical protein
MLEPFFLEGDAYQFERRTKPDGTPDWDLASIASPDAAVLFAIDTSYQADEQENVFRFAEPRAATFTFRLPAWLRSPQIVFRVDAEGVHDANWHSEGDTVAITDTRSRDAIYVATNSDSVRAGIAGRHQAALRHEAAYPVDATALQAIGQ